MSYYKDFSKVTLEEYKSILKNEKLLPSQQILKENIDIRFECIISENIINLQQLKDALKTKKKVEQFAQKTLLPVDYLTILRREINSRHPKPRKLSEFTEINDKLKGKLYNAGIKTTVDLYEKVISASQRKDLGKQIGTNENEILNLAKLANLCRLRYVNHTFATLLVNSEFDTIRKIRNADAEDLYLKLKIINEEKQYFKGTIGKSDMAFLIHEAENTEAEIEY